MTQPKWKCVANLGDVNPIEYGGLFVFVDETGVYPPEIELVDPPCEGQRNQWEVRRGVCEPCTYTNGVLSDNRFHPDKEAWFADDLRGIADSMGWEKEELICALCSPEAIDRASAWKCIADYFGWDNLDSYPIHFNKREITSRVKAYQKQL